MTTARGRGRGVVPGGPAGTERWRPGVAGAPLLRPDTHDQGIWGNILADYPTFPESFGEGELVLDIGCHTGAVSHLAARRGATVIGYEANKENHALACINLASFPSVTVRHAAVWRSDVVTPTLTFTPSEESSNTGGGSVLFESPESHAAARLPWHREDPTPGQPLSAHAVPAVALDEVLTELGPVRLMKIDVEGAEYPILLTARRLDLVREIVGEYHELGSAALAHVPAALRAGLGDWSLGALRLALDDAGFGVTIGPVFGSHGIFRAERAEARR